MVQEISKFSLVMPCFNEQEAIPSLVPRAIRSLSELCDKNLIEDFELIVVNDRSTDSSVQLLKKYPEVKLLHTHGVKRGYGKALKVGFSHAQGYWVGFMDVDNSYRPEDLTRMVQEARKGPADFIIGTRDFDEKGMSFTRGLGNWVYVMLAKYIYNSNLSDICSGYRLFHKKHLPNILDISEDGLDFSIYLTLKMISDQVLLKPVPIQYDKRMGESKLSVVFDGVAFLKVLLTMKMRKPGAVKHSRV